MVEDRDTQNALTTARTDKPSRRAPRRDGASLMIWFQPCFRRSLFDGVPPFDPIALGGAVAIVVGCATVALLIPVRRATRVDPMVALRAN